MRTNATATRVLRLYFSMNFSYHAFSSPYSVSDVTMIHYYGLPNANARINIYYINTKFAGY